MYSKVLKKSLKILLKQGFQTKKNPTMFEQPIHVNVQLHVMVHVCRQK